MFFACYASYCLRDCDKKFLVRQVLQCQKMRQEQRAESLGSISSHLRLMCSKEFRHPKLQPIKSVTSHCYLLMGKSNLRWLYSQGNKATGNWLMKPLGSEVAWEQREGKGSRGDKRQGETTPNLLFFCAFADCFVCLLPSLQNLVPSQF